MSFAIDVNILVFASFPRNSLYKKASAFLNACASDREVCCLCWPTVMGYLRLVTNPAIYENSLTPDEATSNIESLLCLPHIRCISELDGFWEVYRELSTDMTIRGNLLPDAHLAAILRQHGIKRLYTHDKDFRKFSFLDVHDPLI